MKQIQCVKRFHLLGACALALLLCACSPKVNNRGYISSTDIKSQITEGQTTREEVLYRLGSPSVQSSFGPETWYYVSSRKEAIAFLKPEVVQQEITRLQFDPSGVVEKVESFDESNSRDIDYVKRETPTEGHALGFFEQLLGNIGRFNRPSNDTVAPGRRPGN